MSISFLQGTAVLFQSKPRIKKELLRLQSQYQKAPLYSNRFGISEERFFNAIQLRVVFMIFSGSTSHFQTQCNSFPFINSDSSFLCPFTGHLISVNTKLPFSSSHYLSRLNPRKVQETLIQRNLNIPQMRI